MFIYTSAYYQGLIEKARLTNPTPITASGESIEIQHACINRVLAACVLIQTYLAPNLEQRTNGQVKLTVTSFPELGLAGPDTLDQVGNGTLDMANIYTGYVAGAVDPVLEGCLSGLGDLLLHPYRSGPGHRPDSPRRQRRQPRGQPQLVRRLRPVVLREQTLGDNSRHQGHQDTLSQRLDIRLHNRHGRRACIPRPGPVLHQSRLDRSTPPPLASSHPSRTGFMR